MRKVFAYATVSGLLLTSVALGNYVVNSSLKNEEYSDSKYKITFEATDGGADTIIYVDGDYNLSLKDAPFVYQDGAVYEWRTEDGVNLATFDGPITTDMIFTSEVSTSGGELLSEYEPTIRLDASTNTAETSVAYDDVNDIHLGGDDADVAFYSGPTEVNAYVNIPYGTDTEPAYTPKIRYDSTCDDNLYTQIGFHYVNDTFYGTKASNGDDLSYNGDFTIALADTTGEVTDYKPFEGTTTIGSGTSSSGASASSASYTDYATNYIERRFILTRDVVFDGITFNLGAYNGFYGRNNNWAQNNYNNFIVGAYTEIDLNGHDLILANGSTLNAYGSITDSSDDEGTIVVEDGSTLQGLLTLEDCAHETDIVLAYLNQSLFRIFRMPYLDCNIDFEYGSNLTAFCLKDDGGTSSNGHGMESVINLIGTDDDCLIKMTNQTGHITRSVSYDDDIRYSDTENQTLRSNIIRNNLYDQKIRYDFYDCDIEFNCLILSLNYSGMTFDISSADSQFIVPQYFQLFLHNTDVDLDAELVFLPGSHLDVDKDSTINFCYTTFQSSPRSLMISGLYDTLYRSGGLIFTQHLWPISNSGLNNLKDSDSVASEVLNSNEIYWDYLNRNQPASCDLYGMITFDDSITDEYPGYVLSGIINEYNNNYSSIESYLDLQNQINQTQPGIIPCYARSFSLNLLIGTYMPSAMNVGNYVVMNYINSPIISNGKVVSDGTEDGGTYDASLGLINKDDQYYALIFDDAAFLQNWYQDDQLQMKGTYHLVEYDSDSHSITDDGSTYIYYQGIWVKATESEDGSITTADISCFGAAGGIESYSDYLDEEAFEDASLMYSDSYSRWTIES